jgi:hypothetical protein
MREESTVWGRDLLHPVRGLFGIYPENAHISISYKGWASLKITPETFDKLKSFPKKASSFVSRRAQTLSGYTLSNWIAKMDTYYPLFCLMTGRIGIDRLDHLSIINLFRLVILLIDLPAQ